MHSTTELTGAPCRGRKFLRYQGSKRKPLEANFTSTRTAPCKTFWSLMYRTLMHPASACSPFPHTLSPQCPGKLPQKHQGFVCEGIEGHFACKRLFQKILNLIPA